MLMFARDWVLPLPWRASISPWNWVIIKSPMMALSRLIRIAHMSSHAPSWLMVTLLRGDNSGNGDASDDGTHTTRALFSNPSRFHEWKLLKGKFWTTDTHANVNERRKISVMMMMALFVTCCAVVKTKEAQLRRFDKLFLPRKRRKFSSSLGAKVVAWTRWWNSSFLFGKIAHGGGAFYRFFFSSRLVDDFSMNEKSFFFFLLSASTSCHLSFACLCFFFVRLFIASWFMNERRKKKYLRVLWMNRNTRLLTAPCPPRSMCEWIAILL